LVTNELNEAGLPLDHVNGSNTSVYVGCFMNDYETIAHRDLEMPNTYHATGNAPAMLANRINWFYNFSGPSMSVNTACSGSLVALHLACQSLRCGESKMVRISHMFSLVRFYIENLFDLFHRL
jgi:acyl transferase domain-containing protein